MADNMIGSALISVADLIFLDPITNKELGQAITNTDSSLESTMSNNEVRGGYLNGLLFNIMHSRTFAVAATSATFKMLYLAFQSGNTILNGDSSSYITGEHNTAANGVVTLQNTPSGFVHCVLPSGAVVDVQSSGSTSVNVGAGINGVVTCSYFTTKNGDSIIIDAQTQPMVVTCIMKIHGKNQDGSQFIYEVTIPRFQFTGEINFSLTADGVATQAINGTALEYTAVGGQPQYATWTTYPENSVAVIPQAIAAVPNTYTVAVGGVATANIVAIMPPMYTNKVLAGGTTGLTFASAMASTASVDAATGKITGVANGNTTITATYVPVAGTTLTTTINVTVS